MYCASERVLCGGVGVSFGGVRVPCGTNSFITAQTSLFSPTFTTFKLSVSYFLECWPKFLLSDLLLPPSLTFPKFIPSFLVQFCQKSNSLLRNSLAIANFGDEQSRSTMSGKDKASSMFKEGSTPSDATGEGSPHPW